MSEADESATITLEGRGAVQLAKFALGIQETLNRHAHKPGWEGMSDFEIRCKLREEFEELSSAIFESRFPEFYDHRYAPEALRQNISDEAMDLAAVCMFADAVLGERLGETPRAVE